MLFPIVYAAFSQVLGQDTNWDLQNYHYFDSYWLLVNRMRDVVPAQLQTYLSPFLDIPFYFAAQHLPPRLTAALLATIEGTAFPLLYLINRHFTARRLVALGLAGLGMFTAGAISEVGNIMGDSLVAPLFLGAILLGLHSFDTIRTKKDKSLGQATLIVAACGLAGLAAGLKFAELPIALGIAVAFPLVSGSLAWRAKKAIWAAGALVLGMLLSYGWWGYELATHYGNPFLPYMNQIFHSSYAPMALNSGTTPPSVAHILFDPIVWTADPTSVGGLSFVELSLPMVEVLLIVLLVISVGRALFLHRTFEAFANDKQRYLMAVSVISYVVWILEFGDEYRFLIPIELLSFTLIFICLQAIRNQIGWKPLVSVGTIVLALVCVVSEQPMNWGRSAWSATSFSATVPKALSRQSAAFLMLGSNPYSWVVPEFPSGDYFARIEGNLSPTPHVKRSIVKTVASYRRVFTIWADPILQSRISFATDAENRVEEYGFQIDWHSCDGFSGSVGATPEEFHVCRLVTASLSTLAPTTQIAFPANGARLRGHEVLAARAFDATGLRRVEISIVGGGRTMTTRATPSLYGWLVFWNTESVPNGTYTVHSIAYGNNGVVAASSDIVVQVANQK